MFRLFSIAVLAAAALHAEMPDVMEIMHRVAQNTDRAQSARTAWVYDLDTFVRLKRANGKLAREESRTYTVAPTEKGAERRLISAAGKILDGKKEIPYDKTGYRTKNADIDGAIVDSISREIMWRKNMMGLMEYWDPLLSANLAKNMYKLEGEERYKDYAVYRISWRSDPKVWKDDPWEGEMLIERDEYQPVLVNAAWVGKVPVAAAIALGISVKHIGAKITYQRFDKDLWFPVQVGGEMKFRVLFLYARTVAFSGTNRDFRKADVQSSIEFGGAIE